ncbi:MAG TPA: S8 family serine peptidase [Pseudonocardiaceae bacterium]
MRLVLVAALVVFGAAVPAPALAAGCSVPKGTYAGQTPWAQKLVDPARIWPLATGSGVTVAVVGTGVDPANAQFGSGTVSPAIDLLPGGAPDCDGRGTFAAGIIAARSDPATTFAGVAPGARILPIRYTESTTDSLNQGGAPDALAAAIDHAVGASARVILVGVPAMSDSGALDAALQHALAAGDVVVSPATATQAGARSYPTAAAGVLAVGAVNESGGSVQTEAGSYLSIAGPGANLVSTSAGAGGKLGHAWPVQDSSFAAAYVAGAVALLRSYRPDLSPRQVIARLTLTASRPAGGGHDDHVGWGVVDAYAAVSATLPAGVAGPGAAAAVVPNVVAPAGRVAGVSSPYRWVGFVALLAVVLAVLIGIGSVALRRGRARGWRLGRVDVPSKSR